MTSKDYIGRYEVKIFRDMKNSWNGESWFVFGLVMLVLACLSFLVYALVCHSIADGKIDYCQVELKRAPQPGMSNVFLIWGHVPWKDDVILGYEYTQEAANISVKELCPVK